MPFLSKSRFFINLSPFLMKNCFFGEWIAGSKNFCSSSVSMKMTRLGHDDFSCMYLTKKSPGHLHPLLISQNLLEKDVWIFTHPNGWFSSSVKLICGAQLSFLSSVFKHFTETSSTMHESNTECFGRAHISHVWQSFLITPLSPPPYAKKALISLCLYQFTNSLRALKASSGMM